MYAYNIHRVVNAVGKIILNAAEDGQGIPDIHHAGRGRIRRREVQERGNRPVEKLALADVDPRVPEREVVVGVEGHRHPVGPAAQRAEAALLQILQVRRS